ncbi:hypothetical protein NSPZN2_10384 [Nitrospira defluvii]|uniref:Phage protein n=2 Tax=Nitrospira defluvii TaxID=330214 RepID=A0ABM8QFI3_9BACT|nr:hypothetical protein NSPZN2_10384 [Nitrospira defluvii]
MGAGAAQVNGQTIKLTLTPIGDLEIGAKKDHGLAAAIGSVKNALRNAINDPPPLKLDGFVYETEFGIEKTAQGGISFFIIDIAGGKYKQSTIHRLKIHLSLAG